MKQAAKKEQHTPGPWGLSLADTYTIVRPSEIQNERCVVAYAHAGVMGHTIGVGEMEANARLIAAAPDLLAALQEMMYQFEPADPDDNDIYDCDALVIARAAISKALGA